MVARSSAELIMQTLKPHTFNALQGLVMAMAGVANNAGKKTFFGRDKGVSAYEKFQRELHKTLLAMVLDGLASEKTETLDMMGRLFEEIEKFSEIYPNWQDAYFFATHFFVDRTDDALALVDRLRAASV